MRPGPGLGELAGRRPDIRPIGRLVQEVGVNEDGQEGRHQRGIEAEEALGLRDRETQPGHLPVLGLDTLQRHPHLRGPGR